MKKFVLIGRNAEKLRAVKETLMNVSRRIVVETIQHDFDTDSNETLEEALQHFDIGFYRKNLHFFAS